MGKDLIMNWKYFYATEKGTSHIANDTPRQDNCSVVTFKVSGTRYLISVVADGAGSASKSQISSKYICYFFIKRMFKWLKKNNISDFKKEVAFAWIELLHKIFDQAVKDCHAESRREFASTFLFCVLSDKGNLFMQIGDGAIGVEKDNEFDCVFKPQNGEYINTTHFITEDNFRKHLMLEKNKDEISKVAMFTDGIETIALDMQNMKPHAPFFAPFFNVLSKFKNNGKCNALCKNLSEFLTSKRVNKMTNDDKTLVLISTNK